MNEPISTTLKRDIAAGTVVFLVALPLCLGIALASNAPPLAGLIAGIVGGLLVGSLSGSHTSVSGPAAGLSAVVAAQIGRFDSFETCLLVFFVAGAMQLVLGIARLGILAEFIPTSVIKGLLAAIGLILILRQVPIMVGYRGVGATAETNYFDRFHVGAALIGIVSFLLLESWAKIKWLQNLPLPGPLAAVLLGVGMAMAWERFAPQWVLGTTQLVQVPVTSSLKDFWGRLQHPDFSQWNNPLIYSAGLTIAAVASLETLLNLEAVDKIDPRKRTSPKNLELFAQGAGNMVSAALGGLPLTSVIVRSSVNINAGGRTKLSAILHGILLLGCLLWLPELLNRIPLACLAAILVATGLKLINLKLFRTKWRKGPYQYIPFAVTVAAIVGTDLLIGVLIGLAVNIVFILHNTLRMPLRCTEEQTDEGQAMRITLPNQVTFLNRASLSRALHAAPRGGQVILDAAATHFIEPDVIELIRDFCVQTDPPYDVHVKLVGFHPRFGLSS